jgi:hypothetical protein
MIFMDTIVHEWSMYMLLALAWKVTSDIWMLHCFMMFMF